jgi:hypothetical protein
MVRIMPDQSGSPSCRWIIFEPTAYRNATQLMSARLALAAAPSAPQLNGQEKYFKSLSITAATSGITLIASVGRGAVEKIQERQCPERGGGSLLLKGNVLLQEHSENIGLGQRGGNLVQRNMEITKFGQESRVGRLSAAGRPISTRPRCWWQVPIK